MRKIVDSNFLQDDSLEEYLTASSGNYVVLTDYLMMEAYKGNTLKSIFKSMDILSKYPDKVISLKSTIILAGLIPRNPGPAEDLIEQAQTKAFPEFCRNLERAKNGDKGIEKQLVFLGEEAKKQMDILLKASEGLISGIKKVAASYSAEEVKIFKKDQPLTASIGQKFRENTLWLAAYMFQDHPGIQELPKGEELLNTYIFRYAISVQLWVIDWIRKAGFQDAKLETLRNNVVDLHYVACATFFDGFLTKDQKAGDIYTQTKVLLDIFT